MYVYPWNSSNLDEIKAQLLAFNEYFLKIFTTATPVRFTLHHKLMNLMDKYVPSKMVRKMLNNLG